MKINKMMTITTAAVATIVIERCLRRWVSRAIRRCSRSDIFFVIDNLQRGWVKYTTITLNSSENGGEDRSLGAHSEAAHTE
jgi:hypothetical protein